MVFLLAFSIHEEREDVNNLSYQYKEMFLNPRGMGTKKPPWGGWRVVLGLWFRLCSCQSVEHNRGRIDRTCQWTTTSFIDTADLKRICCLKKQVILQCMKHV